MVRNQLLSQYYLISPTGSYIDYLVTHLERVRCPEIMYNMIHRRLFSEQQFRLNEIMYFNIPSHPPPERCSLGDVKYPTNLLAMYIITIVLVISTWFCYMLLAFS